MFTKVSIAAASLSALMFSQGNSASTAAPITKEFLTWASTNGRHYPNSVEMQQRFQLWTMAKAIVDAHNSNPGKTSTMELNDTADLTNAEFLDKFTGVMPISQDQVAQLEENQHDEHRMLQKGGSGTTCPAGTYLVKSGTGKTATSSCVACNSSCATCLSGTSCATCPAGKYKLSTGYCGDCTSTQFVLNGACTNCDASCATCSSASTCSTCPVGKYKLSTGLCGDCTSS